MAGYEQKIVCDIEDKNIQNTEFTTGNAWWEYTVGNTKFFAPAGSKISFEWYGAFLTVPDNSIFDKFPSTTDPQNENAGIMIKWKNIKFPNWDMNLIDGEIMFYSTEDYTLNSGSANYKNNLITIDSEWWGNTVHFYSKSPEKEINWSYVYQSQNGLVINAWNSDSAKIKLLPGHQICDIKPWESLDIEVGQDWSISFWKGDDGKIKTEVYVSDKKYWDGSRVLISDGKLWTLRFTNLEKKWFVYLDRSKIKSDTNIVPMNISSYDQNGYSDSINISNVGEVIVNRNWENIIISNNTDSGESQEFFDFKHIVDFSSIRLSLKDSWCDETQVEELIRFAINNNGNYDKEQSENIAKNDLKKIPSILNIIKETWLAPEDALNLIKKMIVSDGLDIFPWLISKWLSPIDAASLIEKTVDASSRYSNLTVASLPGLISAGISPDEIISLIQKINMLWQSRIVSKFPKIELSVLSWYEFREL